MEMATFTDVSVTFDGGIRPTLKPFSLEITEGEFVLVSGPTGAGKSTLLKCLCGLVPHFTGGTVTGTVRVAGRDTRDNPPRELADQVGYVGQDPSATFVADQVEDELAYTMENLGLAPMVMRRRIEEVIDLMGLEAVRRRRLDTLSGGEQQRVAIAAVLTASPRLLVLDEPTSSLDPLGAEEVLSSLGRLCHDAGLTIVVAEHRLERIVHLAERLVVVESDGRVWDDRIAEALVHAPLAPPIVALGRLFGWNPLPLSIRDARRAAAPLRDRIAALVPPAVAEVRQATARARPAARPPAVDVVPRAPAPLRIERLTAEWAGREVVHGLDLTVEGGEILAIMGRNGSGKSTVLGCAVGSKDPRSGTVSVAGTDPRALSGARLTRLVGLVPQDPSLLLYTSSAAEECELADVESGLESGTTRARLAELTDTIDPGTHPRDLSEGQRLLLALAVVTAHRPGLLLLDEPTRGLDYEAKHRLVRLLDDMARSGTAVVVATHDVELVAHLAQRVLVLAHGEIIADGPAADVVCHSPTLAPQVAKIVAPNPILTLAELQAALGMEPPTADEVR